MVVDREQASGGHVDAHSRVDAAQPAQHGPAGRRTALPVAGPRPGGRRLGPGAADGRPASPTSSTATSPAGSTSSSELGQILDPVADRLYILAVVVGLALRDIIPWWLALSLPLRDLLLWGLVPLLRTRGYSALPVHFLGKAATFNLLYAFPLLLLGDGEGTVAATRPRSSAGRSRIWGIGLYWWAGVLYAWQVRKLLRHHRTPRLGARCLSRPPARSAPTAGPRHHAAADPDHPAVARRGLPARRRPARGRPRRPERPAARGRDGRGGRRRASACWSRSPRSRPRATPTSTTRAGAALIQPDRDQRGRRRRRCRTGSRSLPQLGTDAARRPASTCRPRPAEAVEARLEPAPGATGFVAGHRARASAITVDDAADGDSERQVRDHRPARCWSTACGAPAPRRSRSTASGSPSLTRDPQRPAPRSRSTAGR